MDRFHQLTAVNEFYHVYNRGNHKQEIFMDENDYKRFLFLILATQFPFSVNNTGSLVNNFFSSLSLFGHLPAGQAGSISKKVILPFLDKKDEERTVDLVAFSLMPNHFHLILSEKQPGGIKRYMQKLGNAYTKYFNTRYKTKGHLFEGRYSRVHMSDNTQLLHTSAYIHRNARELSEWQNKESEYPWSSYQDYLQKNRWNGLLSQEIILGQFTELQSYKNFVETSPTKLTEEETSMLQ